MPWRLLLAGILFLCAGAALYLLDCDDAAQICILAGLAMFMAGIVLGKRAPAVISFAKA